MTATTDTPQGKGPLNGLIVLDLSRILAGPTCTQILGDLGATIIKIERVDRGDDTRGWGPPFLKDKEGKETRESAYYLSANRNKHSVAIDLSQPAGAALIKRLAEKADVLIENFKVGDLDRKGLGYEELSALNPRLIYCSITGFGQTGPYAQRAGYDFIVQGMGGIMSLTGETDENGGIPTKVGVGVSDVICGMYAANAILAATVERTSSGKGQYIDISLLDAQVAWLINQGVAYLVSGEVPGRLGNAHPTIVPYETFPASDGQFILAAGNDAQFQRFCEVANAPELAEDPRFVTNADRVRNRKELIPLIRQQTVFKSCEDWISELEAVGVPCGPVNDLKQVFDNPQVQHREMKVTLEHPTSNTGTVDLIGSPMKLSRTPVTYRQAPPTLGAHTKEILAGFLDLDDDTISKLAEDNTIDLGAST
ncbi:CaiB/BaiF CoA-transferase family protein [Pseudovibrio sp. SPO723]|uniref:CaiB/BaiF CoA transferase family protein n=1 Tax=Nesiotobacter zosterae TaxID=392721 RepID=UPI0029C45AE6|nr:CaiB/BaiF CoA-transferase family protein [Pseudovibrio sp. SPO723]MDX5592247.1 CaiB/BaiF CoA-transferase family protein [Pseudovibrio sp. SPO723]